MACVAVVGWTSPQSLARPQRRTAALPWCFAGGSRRCSAFPRHTVRPLAQLLPLLRAPAAQNALDNVSNRVGVVAGTAQGAEASRLDPFRSAASRPVPRSWPPQLAAAPCPCRLPALLACCSAWHPLPAAHHLPLLPVSVQPPRHAAPDLLDDCREAGGGGGAEAGGGGGGGGGRRRG